MTCHENLRSVFNWASECRAQHIMDFVSVMLPGRHSCAGVWFTGLLFFCVGFGFILKWKAGPSNGLFLEYFSAFVWFP